MSSSSYYDSSSSNYHDPSGFEAKEPGDKAPDSSSYEIELLTLNSPTFAVDFDEKAFEDHAKAVTSLLKDDCGCSSASSRSSSIESSTFS